MPRPSCLSTLPRQWMHQMNLCAPSALQPKSMLQKLAQPSEMWAQNEVSTPQTLAQPKIRNNANTKSLPCSWVLLSYESCVASRLMIRAGLLPSWFSLCNMYKLYLSRLCLSDWMLFWSSFMMLLLYSCPVFASSVACSACAIISCRAARTATHYIWKHKTGLEMKQSGFVLWLKCIDHCQLAAWWSCLDLYMLIGPSSFQLSAIRSIRKSVKKITTLIFAWIPFHDALAVSVQPWL